MAIGQAICPPSSRFKPPSSCRLVAAAVCPGRSVHRDFMHGAGAFRNRQRSANVPCHGWNKRDRNGTTSVGSERRGAVISLGKGARPTQGEVADSHRHAIRVGYSQILARVVAHHVAIVEDDRGRREHQPSSQSRRASPRQPHCYHSTR